MTAASSALFNQKCNLKLPIIAFVVLGLYNGAYVARWWLGSPQPPFGDFFGFWSFGKFAATFGSAIYDPFALAAYQHALYPALQGGYPYPYPPTFLLVLIPLGMMTLPSAYFCWVLATFSLYVLATLGRNWWSISGLALLTAPTTLIVAISGQNGFLSAALLIGGLRCLSRSPACGGVLLGLLTYKPQFVLLLPIVLIASRNLSAILAACATALFVVAASSAALDWSIWQHWIAGFSTYQSLLQTNQASLDHLMPTMVAGVHALGAPVSIGHAAQFLCSGVVVVLTWCACARRIDERSIAMAAIGSIVVAPYAMIYDMPMVAAAIAIHWRARAGAGVPILIPEVVLVVALFACLLAMIGSSVPFAASALVFLLFLVIAASREAELNRAGGGVGLATRSFHL
jgi:Glycosyltransferase family 87